MARGLAGYFDTFLQGLGAELPTWLTSYILNEAFDLNILAGVAVILITVALFAGTEGSALANHVSQTCNF